MRFFSWLAGWIRRPVFVISLKDGSATPERGNLSVSFLADCADLARKRGLRAGRVFGMWKAGGVSLEFSPEIPEEHHQVFRNVWALHRRRHKR